MTSAVVLGCFPSKTVCFRQPDTRVGRKHDSGTGFGLFSLQKQSVFTNQTPGSAGLPTQAR